MGLEIERKYLVVGEFKKYAFKSISIKQGYLSREKERTVRVRVADKTAYITIKGKQKGISRFEWEKEIPLAEAEELLQLCIDDIIDKKRYLVESGDFTIEVDEFFGANKGLVIAEIELDSENVIPELPDWIGQEVSSDYSYHNSQLSRMPYKKWNK